MDDLFRFFDCFLDCLLDGFLHRRVIRVLLHLPGGLLRGFRLLRNVVDRFSGGLRLRAALAVDLLDLLPGLLEIRLDLPDVHDGRAVRVLEVLHRAGDIPRHAVADAAERAAHILQLLKAPDQLVDAVLELDREFLRLRLDPVHNAAGDRLTEGFLLRLQFILSALDLRLRVFQFFQRLAQPVVRERQDPVVHVGDLGVVQLDLDALLHEADRRDFRDALLPLKVRHDVVLHIVRQLVDVVALAADREVHRRDHVHADLEDARRPAAVGQRRPRLLDRARHLDHGAVHVGAVLEFQLCHGIIFRTHRVNIFDVGDRAEGALHRLTDRRLHPFRARAGVRRHDDHVRQGHGRQEVCRHIGDRDKAEYDHDQYCDQHGKGSSDAEFFHILYPDHSCLLQAGSNAVSAAACMAPHRGSLLYHS